MTQKSSARLSGLKSLPETFIFKPRQSTFCMNMSYWNDLLLALCDSDGSGLSFNCHVKSVLLPHNYRATYVDNKRKEKQRTSKTGWVLRLL